MTNDPRFRRFAIETLKRARDYVAEHKDEFEAWKEANNNESEAAGHALRRDSDGD